MVQQNVMAHGAKCNTQIKKYQKRHILMIHVNADIIQDYNKHRLCAVAFFVS